MANARGQGGRGGRTVEISARTVDEAIAQALTQLRLTRDDVEVEVLQAGSPGRLLGFGAEPARVRVTATSGPRTAARSDDEEDGEAVGEATAEAGDDAEDVETQEDEERTPESLEGEAEMARLMLVEMLNRMGLDDTTVEVGGTEPILLNIMGDDLADLIGRRGENLRSLQFILNLMVNKQLRRRLRVQLDVDGYRLRREELLRGMAQRFAHRVRTTREAMQLETMPPNERRIIHMELAEDPDVMTESTGEGDSRRVVIKPRR
ncbi:MAG TPA: RNA-binding cell elongation regulator Jag/EloR [Chloroflexota bacterium]|nr:RNA-binding cell elongation regulator Jag/EloR [Chloroflexota bacterium]